VSEILAVKQLTGDDDFDRILSICFDVLKIKGRDYTIESPDRLKNFKDVASMVDVPPMKVLATYLWKHIAAVFSYIKSGGQNESEPIEMRIVDCINYLLLLGKMVSELGAKSALGELTDEMLKRISFTDDELHRLSTGKLGVTDVMNERYPAFKPTEIEGRTGIFPCSCDESIAMRGVLEHVFWYTSVHKVANTATEAIYQEIQALNTRLQVPIEPKHA
jgi:hypothetical protein